MDLELGKSSVWQMGNLTALRDGDRKVKSKRGKHINET